MKRSELIKFIADKLFYGKLAEAARSDTRPKFTTDLAEEDAESILKELEDIGMFYCPVEDLGSIGKLRTPKGFEPEISEALDKFLNETGWDDEEK